MATVYKDARGWLYKVMPGIGGNCYKARYQKPGLSGWKTCKALPWRKTEKAAQSDLDDMAMRKRFFLIVEE